MIGFAHGYALIAALIKKLGQRALEKEISHGGNPVLKWMTSNVFIKQDAAGNMKSDTSKGTKRIDGIVASMMALNRGMPAGD